MLPVSVSISSRSRIFCLLSVILLMFVFCEDAFAESGWLDDSGSSFVGVVSGLLHAFTLLCKGVLLIAGIGALFFAIMSMLNGEQAGAKRFFIWLAGLAIGFAIVSVLGNVKVSGGRGVADAGAFTVFKQTVKSLVQVLMIVVSMVCVVKKVIQLINGEKEGGRELFKWFAVSVVGFALIGVI